jgi:hypothetical protein
MVIPFAIIGFSALLPFFVERKAPEPKPDYFHKSSSSEN